MQQVQNFIQNIVKNIIERSVRAIATKTAEMIGKRAAMSAGKIALKGALHIAGQSLNAIAPFLGGVVGFIGSELASKLIFDAGKIAMAAVGMVVVTVFAVVLIDTESLVGPEPESLQSYDINNRSLTTNKSWKEFENEILNKSSSQEYSWTAFENNLLTVNEGVIDEDSATSLGMTNNQF